MALCLGFQKATHTAHNILKPFADITSLKQLALQSTIDYSIKQL